MGTFYDANGSAVSLFTEFGVVQQDQSMALSTSASSKARENAELVKEKIEDALDGVGYTGIDVICSPGFWKKLLEDKDNKEKIRQALETVAKESSDPANPGAPTFGALLAEGKLPGGPAE